MPKRRVKRSVARRFKITKTGKVMFAHQNHGHHKMHRSGSRNRRGKEPGVLAPEFAKKVRKMLSYV